MTSVYPLNLDFRLSERWLTKLKPGDVVAVTVDAMPGEQFEGRIVALAPQVDVNGRAVQLRATVPNADRTLRPGLFARVTLELDQRPDAVLVPEAAIVLQESGPMLYRIEEGKAVATRITTGVRRDGMVEITAGPRRRRYRGRQRPCPPARPVAGRGRPAGRRRADPR